MNSPQNPISTRCPTGIQGLDEITFGGLPSHCLYVVQGEPGSGKTTLSLQFLLAGAKNGEKGLYITFSETRRELEAVAASHGWKLDALSVIDLSMLEGQIAPESQTTLFHPSEVELNHVTELLMERILELKPARIVFDSISEMRLLAETPLRYRRQVLMLKQSLAQSGATVLFLDDLTASVHDLQVQSIAHGVIHLGRLHHEFGRERRRMRILKLRGVDFTGGYHDFDILHGGVTLYPRLVASEHRDEETPGQLSSGSVELDALVGGGLDRGTSNLLIGPAGTGKSTIGMKYALAAAQAGEKVAFFSFDETTSNFKRRAHALGLDFETPTKAGFFHLQKIDPAELSPGAFSGLIRELVSHQEYRVIVIDSLNGYIQAMPQEQFLLLQLHELLAYLNNKGIVTLMMLAQAGMVGTMQAPVDLTYLADTVLMTRYFESNGALRKALSVVKKRTGDHETTIREYRIGPGGVHVGEVLGNFSGILTGVPRANDLSAGEPALNQKI